MPVPDGNSRADALASPVPKRTMSLNFLLSRFHFPGSWATSSFGHYSDVMNWTFCVRWSGAFQFPPYMDCDAVLLCTPASRAVRSFRVHRCVLRFSEVIKPGSVETSFLNILGSANPIPENLRQTLAVHYITLHRLRSLPRVLGPVGRLHDLYIVCHIWS